MSSVMTISQTKSTSTFGSKSTDSDVEEEHADSEPLPLSDPDSSSDVEGVLSATERAKERARDASLLKLQQPPVVKPAERSRSAKRKTAKDGPRPDAVIVLKEERVSYCSYCTEAVVES